MTIVEFLEARLAEDEQAALAAQNSVPWSANDQDVASRHLSRHLPARVLREVVAKRAILREYVDSVKLHEDEAEAPDAVAALEIVVRHMASVYADHPEFEGRWAP